MATQKKNTVYILLSIALIWNYGSMASNVKWDCEFDSPMMYDESSDCPNGATGLMLCEPGQKKISSCINASEHTTICEDCPHKFFLANFNNCTNCHECSECDGTDAMTITSCDIAKDTVCETTTTSTTSQESTTTPSRVSVSTRDSQTDESDVAMTTCENCKTTQSSNKTTIVTGSGNRAPENGLSQGNKKTIIIVVICVIVIPGLVVVVLVVLCLLRKVNCPLRNNNQQPNARNGGAHPNNGPQGTPLRPINIQQQPNAGDGGAPPDNGPQGTPLMPINIQQQPNARIGGAPPNNGPQGTPLMPINIQQQPNAGDGGAPPDNGPQGDPLLPRNGDAAARPEAND
ncbi:uncharacterized protein [Diadema antillarum]|uniref:uncharacterized protein n=1 Tax=Diadema antillarum TaxID=105358 RepID=UPI003A88B1EF